MKTKLISIGISMIFIGLSIISNGQTRKDEKEIHLKYEKLKVQAQFEIACIRVKTEKQLGLIKKIAQDSLSMIKFRGQTELANLQTCKRKLKRN